MRTTVVRSTVGLLLLLASCGGGGSGETSTSPSSSDSVPTDGGSSSAPDSQGTTKKQKARVERPSGAPLGEVIPPGDDAYLLLSSGRCTELLRRTETWRQGENPVNEDAFFLYRAAAKACLERWDDAQRDYERLEDLAPSFSGDCDSTNCERCMRAVKKWLDDVIALHRRAPGDDVEYVKGTQSSPCPEGDGTPDDETTTTEDATTSSRPRTSTSRTTVTTRS